MGAGERNCRNINTDFGSTIINTQCGVGGAEIVRGM